VLKQTPSEAAPRAMPPLMISNDRQVNKGCENDRLIYDWSQSLCLFVKIKHFEQITDRRHVVRYVVIMLMNRVWQIVAAAVG